MSTRWVPGKINDLGQREYVLIICKCDMHAILMKFGMEKLTQAFPVIPEGDYSVEYAVDKAPEEEHFDMAIIRMHAIPQDLGRPN